MKSLNARARKVLGVKANGVPTKGAIKKARANRPNSALAKAFNLPDPSGLKPYDDAMGIETYTLLLTRKIEDGKSILFPNGVLVSTLEELNSLDPKMMISDWEIIKN